MKNLYFKNLKRGRIFLAVIFFMAVFIVSSNAAILVYIGSSDGSPYHVPYQGVVDMPVWIDDIYNATYANIILRTLNSAVSERLGGNFYFPWWHEFWDPIYSQYWSSQNLSFISSGLLDSLSHLADFTFRMDMDTSYIGDTLFAMNAMVSFTDSSGYNILEYQINISQVVVDDITSVEKENLIPENMFINMAYPNPFNANVTVRYSLPTDSDVNLVIYDIGGREVKTIYKESVSAGEHSIAWNGTDNSGEKVASGIYVYRITAAGYEATSRMTLLK